MPRGIVLPWLYFVTEWRFILRKGLLRRQTPCYYTGNIFYLAIFSTTYFRISTFIKAAGSAGATLQPIGLHS